MRFWDICSDTHIFGVKEKKKYRKDVFECDICLGDIVDFTNTRKKKLDEAYAFHKKLKDKKKSLYIFGNHEAQEPPYYYVKKSNVLFCHGHTLLWSKEKVEKWENKKHGRSSFIWYPWRVAIKLTFLKRGMFDPKNEVIEKCADILSKYSCDTIVFGHTHTKKLYDEWFEVDDVKVRIVNVPMGRTKIEL